MLAAELVSDREARTPLPMDAAPQDVIRREAGVIVRDCAHNLVISPPLILSRQEADEIVGGMRSVLERVDATGQIAGA
jgi:adenosylmethionine-8-amino-7-oxononanoate aminotransferase